MFPNKKYLIFKDGWKDLGKVDVRYKERGEIISTEKHVFCGKRIRIGKENNTLFKYCPRCLIKTFFDPV